MDPLTGNLLDLLLELASTLSRSHGLDSRVPISAQVHILPAPHLHLDGSRSPTAASRLAHNRPAECLAVRVPSGRRSLDLYFTRNSPPKRPADAQRDPEG